MKKINNVWHTKTSYGYRKATDSEIAGAYLGVAAAPFAPIILIWFFTYCIFYWILEPFKSVTEHSYELNPLYLRGWKGVPKYIVDQSWQSHDFDWLITSAEFIGPFVLWFFIIRYFMRLESKNN